jgi:hypothetical protein
MVLPNEQPQQMLDTIINWGRYAEILLFDSGTEEVALSEAGDGNHANDLGVTHGGTTA